VVLLSLLLLFLLAIPLLEPIGADHPHLVRGTMFLLFVTVLLSAVFTVCDSRQRRVIAIFLVGSTAVTHTVRFFIQTDAVLVADLLLGGAFLFYAVVLILKSLFERDRVNFNLICASLCVYLLLGILWANIYSLIDVAEVDAFHYSLPEEGEMRFGGELSTTPLYYSFVTMTTLGYGDVIPKTVSARMLAAFQALLGQLYLAVLVARLVGLHISQSTATAPAVPESNPDSGPEPRNSGAG
jgi:hypothetical protein